MPWIWMLPQPKFARNSGRARAISARPCPPGPSRSCPRATILVDQRAFAYHVVNDDQAAAARELQRPAEILGSALLIGIDENEIEWPACLGSEKRQGLERGPDAHLYPCGETCTCEIGSRHFGKS